MRRTALLLAAPLLFAASLSAQSRIEVVPDEAPAVDITVDGKPFTAYIWPTTLKKPVLYPLRSAKGTVVTRGFPLDRVRASASIIRTTSASGSTTATSTASTSGTTPTRSRRRRRRRWARSCIARSSRRRAAPARAS